MCPHCMLMGLIGIVMAVPLVGQSLKWLRMKYCKKKECECPKCKED